MTAVHYQRIRLARRGIWAAECLENRVLRAVLIGDQADDTQEALKRAIDNANNTVSAETGEWLDRQLNREVYDSPAALEDAYPGVHQALTNPA